MEHTLNESGDFAEVRQKYFDAENLQQLFDILRVTLRKFNWSQCHHLSANAPAYRQITSKAIGTYTSYRVLLSSHFMFMSLLY